MSVSREPLGTRDRGQASVLGTVLVIALTIIGTTATLTFGAASLKDAKQGAQFQKIEHTMTSLDSRMALVALGGGNAQSISLGDAGEGRYFVDEDAGWARIVHHNYSGNGNAETIANITLGAVVYENGDTRIAYQGGGVWRQTDEGTAMVSPPEFHYRDATLTFPIIRVAGSGGTTEPATVEMRTDQQSRHIFENASASYTGSSDAYRNPLTDGTVTVTVHSQDYRAWAEYFRTRTDGTVTVHDNNKTATVLLLTQGTEGDFEMPPEGGNIELRGFGDTHPLTNFTFTLFDDDQDQADFSNLKWSLYANEGSQRFEVHVRDDSGGVCGGDVRITIYYSDDRGDHYQSWTNDEAFEYECESAVGQDFNNDGDQSDKRLIINLTANVPMEYEPVSGGDAETKVYNVQGSDDFVDPITFDEHKDAVAWESETYDDDDTESLGRITNHYFSRLGPQFDLTVDDKNGDTVSEDKSHGTIEFESGGQFITYLHVTENEVDVEFE